MGFQNILGNSRVKKILKLALEKQRLPNSLLFWGPAGVGKKDMALVLAKAMNCEREKNDACETCSACRAINEKKMPDVLEIEPEKDTIRIDQIRFLKELAYFKPMSQKKRIFILDQAEKMNEEAANAFLKVLEEPPLFSHFFLITSNPYLILPTIKSRCLSLELSPLSREEVKNYLLERGFQEEKARILAMLARGNLGQALAMDWEEIQGRRKQAWQILLGFLGKEKSSFFLSDYAFSQRNIIRKELEQILEILSSFYRDIIVWKEKGGEGLLFNPDFKQEIQKLEDELSLEDSFRALELIEQTISGLNKNLNVSLLVSYFYSHMKRQSHG